MEVQKLSSELTMLFQISRVDIINCVLHTPNPPITPAVVYNFNIFLEQKYDLTNKLVQVLVKVDVSAQDRQDEILGSITIGCVFLIENFNEVVVTNKNNLLVMNDMAAITLNSISLSTMRGVMIHAFRGSLLHNAILPVIDPKKFQAQIKP